jgi:hypothetical protein
VVLIGLLLALGLRAGQVYTESINWDEFNLLHMAVQTDRTGALHAGGRPGLAVVLLLPFVAGCEDEIAIVHRARLLWVGLTGLYLAGIYALLLQLLRRSPRRHQAAELGVALLALTPTFLQWSLQVRSDQLALAAGTWGAVALLASRRRIATAGLAGLLLGVGYLASQKALYVAALAGLLVAADLLREGELRPRRELARAALVVALAAAVLVAYEAMVAILFVQPRRFGVGGGMRSFDFYRQWVGYRQYAAMLPTLAPHGLLLAAGGAATALALRRGERPDARLLLAGGVAALGLGVGLFHAGAYFYFWMTLGLFPALALALAYEPIRDAFPAEHGRLRALFLAAVWSILGLQGVLQLGLLLTDTQAEQRAALGFAERSFARSEAGFQPEHALFCQDDGPPFETYFSEQIHRRFRGPNAERNVERLRERFLEKPVHFLVGSWRMALFPQSLQRFWLDNYQLYNSSVWVAGRRLQGRSGDRLEVEIVAPGEYRWLPFAGERTLSPGAQRIAVDGRELGAGDTLHLAGGVHRIELLSDIPRGVLVLALSEPYRPRLGVFYAGAESSLIQKY